MFAKAMHRASFEFPSSRSTLSCSGSAFLTWIEFSSFICSCYCKNEAGYHSAKTFVLTEENEKTNNTYDAMVYNIAYTILKEVVKDDELEKMTLEL